MIRKIYQEFASANILGVKLEHTGFQGGNANTGGYVRIVLTDLACTSMFLNGNECREVELMFKGDTERVTLLSALKMIVKELEDNEQL